MGTCANIVSQRKEKTRRESVLSFGWGKESGCFDKFRYITNIDQKIYYKTQLAYMSNWYDSRILLDFEETVGYNVEFVAKHIEKLKK